MDRTRVYWLLPGMDRRIGFAETVGDTTNFYYYLTDHVGTVMRIVKEDGTVVNQYDYDAFGRVRMDSANTFEGVENRYLFQGREWDKHGGFYYFRNRIYLPERGEFASPDMNLGRGILGEIDGMATLTFCGGDPVNCVDPTGLEPITLTVVAYYTLTQAGFSVLETGVEYGFHKWLGEEGEEFNFSATLGKNFAVNMATAGIGGKANKARKAVSIISRFMARQGVEVAGDTLVDVCAYDRNLDESLARNTVGSLAGEGIGRGAGWAWKKAASRFGRGAGGTVLNVVSDKLDDPPCGPRNDLVTSPASTAGAGGAVAEMDDAMNTIARNMSKKHGGEYGALSDDFAIHIRKNGVVDVIGHRQNLDVANIERMARELKTLNPKRINLIACQGAQGNQAQKLANLTRVPVLANKEILTYYFEYEVLLSEQPWGWSSFIRSWSLIIPESLK